VDQNKKSNTLSAMFLVAGTCIGGGMLALPVATGVSGFLPAMAIMFLCWFAMTCSALFLLEANLWMKEGAHVITMASTLLGPIGKVVSWCLFLFISYASLVAYTSAGGSLFASAFQHLDFIPSKELSCALFILIFGGVLYLGTQIVGRVNSILVIAMIAAYVGLIGSGAGEVDPQKLLHQHWPTSLLAIPVLLSTFSFQTMLPSLTPYLKRNARALRIAVIGGTTITFIIYTIWQILVLGIIPVHGQNSLLTALEAGEPVTQFLHHHINGDWLAFFAEYFAFFALVTSFLGIGLGLFDFLADGFKIKKTAMGQLLLGFLVIVPTYFFSIYFDRIFLIALDTTGGFGDSILNGIMPVLMVWLGRYWYKFPSENRTWGGKPLLVLVMLFFVTALCIEIFIYAGHISPILDHFQTELKS
jgi:tyrosine-specific transport protein